MSNNSSTIFQEPIELTSAEVAQRFQHAFNENIKLRNENFRLQMRLDDALRESQVLNEKVKTMREVGNNYVSQLEVRVAESQQERDALLIRVGYLERTIELLKGETK